jgi:hypothetical protein
MRIAIKAGDEEEFYIELIEQSDEDNHTCWNGILTLNDQSFNVSFTE